MVGDDYLFASFLNLFGNKFKGSLVQFIKVMDIKVAALICYASKIHHTLGDFKNLIADMGPHG